MERRKFIALAGTTATTISIAGCASPDEAGTAGGAGATEGTEAGADETEGEDGGDGETTEEADDEVTTTESGEETTDESASEEVDPADVEGETDDVSENAEVVSHEAFRDGETVGVRGSIENTADEALDFVEVEVTLNDGDTVLGEFIDTSDEEIDSLAPGDQWDFEVTFDDEALTSETTYTISVEAETGAVDGTGTGTETTA
ncbi:DUF3426 domain-containing protein [Halorubellus sp. JP-L1]|uniref:FxLYD domain-containing protein n=1 Tax=Halorubellus sp. JP-L1 TaxID=2715753 RepID=UPI001409ED34|nr:FxLYD domain-containing protein [Halorubellus sp. JP-L1]NHN42732.1 DUF3426 domain-containing protein [Halorubellus sp. JP-L1]